MDQLFADAERLSRIFGTRIEAFDTDPAKGLGPHFVLPIAAKGSDKNTNIDRARRIMDDLRPVRAAAGIDMDDLQFRSPRDVSSFIISATDIKNYDALHGEGELFKRLESVQRDLQAVMLKHDFPPLPPNMRLVVPPPLPKNVAKPAEEAAAAAAKTAEKEAGWVARVWNHPLGKTSVFVTSAVVVGSVGYWLIKDKKRKQDPDPGQPTR